MITHLRALPRPEGGAVALHFALSDDLTGVRVLRGGVAFTSPTDPTASVIYDGLPPTTGYHPFVAGGNKNVAHLLDLYAFAARFEDEPNVLEGTVVYSVFGRVGATHQPPVTATATPVRTITVSYGVGLDDLKTLLYQRLRYHALTAPLKTFVSKSETLDSQQDNQLLIKTRKVLDTIPLGAQPGKVGLEQTLLFRTIAELNLLATTPENRDTLGTYFETCLLGDLNLLSSLNWNNPNFSSQDRDADTEYGLRYSREISLDGTTEATIITPRTVNVADITFTPCSFQLLVDPD